MTGPTTPAERSDGSDRSAHSDQRLAEVFVELAGGSGDELLDSQELLDTLTACIAELLPGCTATAVALPVGGYALVSAGSDEGMAALMRSATDWGEGPGQDVHRTGQPIPWIRLDCGPSRQRWPRWSPRALRLGYGRAAAMPMRGRGETVGALVLFARGNSVAGEHEALALAQALADTAGIALAREREVRESRTLAAQLEYALTSRIVVEQAKGVLATRQSISMDDAFTILRGYARAHRRKLAEVAREVIEGVLEVTGRQESDTAGPRLGEAPSRS